MVAKDLEYQYSHDKLARTEISTLIGLMLQRPIDLSLPEPNAVRGYIGRTEALLNEFHQAMTRLGLEGGISGQARYRSATRSQTLLACPRPTMPGPGAQLRPAVRHETNSPYLNGFSGLAFNPRTMPTRNGTVY